jgi:thioredoxin 1
MNQITDETFQQEVGTGVVLVDFYADWCGPCRAASPAIEQIANDYAGKAKVVKHNIDTGGSRYAVENGVRGIPNFCVFKDGVRVNQFVGWSDSVEKEIRAALDEALTS